MDRAKSKIEKSRSAIPNHKQGSKSPFFTSTTAPVNAFFGLNNIRPKQETSQPDDKNEKETNVLARSFGLLRELAKIIDKLSGQGANKALVWQEKLNTLLAETGSSGNKTEDELSQLDNRLQSFILFLKEERKNIYLFLHKFLKAAEQHSDEDLVPLYFGSDKLVPRSEAEAQWDRDWRDAWAGDQWQTGDEARAHEEAQLREIEFIGLLETFVEKVNVSAERLEITGDITEAIKVTREGKSIVERWSQGRRQGRSPGRGGAITSLGIDVALGITDAAVAIAETRAEMRTMRAFVDLVEDSRELGIEVYPDAVRGQFNFKFHPEEAVQARIAVREKFARSLERWISILAERRGGRSRKLAKGYQNLLNHVNDEIVALREGRDVAVDTLGSGIYWFLPVRHVPAQKYLEERNK